MIKDDFLRKNYNTWYDVILAGKKADYLPKQTHKFYSSLFVEAINLVKKAHKGEKLSLLDVACGTGRFLKYAKELGIDIFGIDISNVAVREAKKISGGVIKMAQAEKIPFNKDKFDLVTCIGSLEHFADPKKSIYEMRRVLKKRGIAVIHVPNLMFIGHIYMAARYGVMPSEGNQEFSENYSTFLGWKELLEDNGLKVVKVTSYNDVFVSKKVSPLILFLWQLFVKDLIPFNLRYSFNFYCQKK